MNFASDTDIQKANRIPFSVCVLYAIGKGDISQPDIYLLWVEYWCEEEEGNFVFPMSDIEFQLDVYSPIQIVKMLSDSRFNLNDRWGCTYWENGNLLTSNDYLPLLIKMETMMKWVDRTGNQALCPPVLYSLWVEWKRGCDIE